MFKTLPLNPPLLLLRWSNEKPRSRDLHGCHGHETITGHGCRNTLQKKMVFRFVMIKQCYMRTHALNINEKLTRMLIFSYIGLGHIHGAASLREVVGPEKLIWMKLPPKQRRFRHIYTNIYAASLYEYRGFSRVSDNEIWMVTPFGKP